jgi:hypothetical protein
MPLQGSLSIERMCELARVSRASFYRALMERRPSEEETEVRSAIQQIALEHRRRYGYRRICAELRRRGMPVNHKRVLRSRSSPRFHAILVEVDKLAEGTREIVLRDSESIRRRTHPKREWNG